MIIFLKALPATNCLFLTSLCLKVNNLKVSVIPTICPVPGFLILHLANLATVTGIMGDFCGVLETSYYSYHPYRAVGAAVTLSPVAKCSQAVSFTVASCNSPSCRQSREETHTSAAVSLLGPFSSPKPA